MSPSGLFVLICVSDLPSWDRLLNPYHSTFLLCSTIIYIIMRERCAFSLVASCVLLKYTRMETSTDGVSNLANLFRGSSHDFCQLYYNINK